MSRSGGTSGGSGRDGDGGTRIDVRGDGRSRISVAGRDMNTTYFVSASSAALAALVGLVLLLGMWHPWQETASTRDHSGTAVGSGPSGGSSAGPAPYRESPPAGEDDGGTKVGATPAADPSPIPSPIPSLGPSPSPRPDPPPDPVDVAFASVGVGTCLNVYDSGWGTLNHDRPFAVDCGASFAYSKVTLVTTSASNCPQGAGRRGWAHVNSDGTSVALCLDRVFAAGQCFPATLSRQADGSLHGEGQLFSVWACDGTRVPRGRNAIMVITAVLRGGGCPQRTDRQTLSWPVFNGAGELCAERRAS
ncbi:hypothetical protein [Streptomyces sp. NPDC005423]|uniref:hypothetical protein n=1 Tax=Streptomyces sp. NPDC005423 TaxID=3155343 RepID=UPI0033A31C49